MLISKSQSVSLKEITINVGIRENAQQGTLKYMRA